MSRQRPDGPPILTIIRHGYLRFTGALRPRCAYIVDPSKKVNKTMSAPPGWQLMKQRKQSLKFFYSCTEKLEAPQTQPLARAPQQAKLDIPVVGIRSPTGFIARHRRGASEQAF
jgi:hypothetical protein